MFEGEEKICQYTTCGRKAIWACKLKSQSWGYDLCAIHKDKFTGTFDKDDITIEPINQ